jgi:small-conductance mechanosensitive channel
MNNLDLAFISNLDLFGKNLSDWLFALILIAMIIGALILVKRSIVKYLVQGVEKKENKIFNFLISAVEKIGWPFYSVTAIYFSLDIFDLSLIVQQWIYYIFIVVVVYYALKFGEGMIDLGLEAIKKEEAIEDKSKTLDLLGKIAKVALWVMAVILVLSNFGYNVTSLIAGLGIGGLAIAMASQQVLSELIAAVVIFLDQPFRLGDRLTLGDLDGQVMKITWRSTRLKANSGEEIVISNSEILKSKIRNFSRK